MPSKRTDLTALALGMTVPSVAAYAYFVLLSDSPAARTTYVLSRVFLVSFPVAWFLLVERGRPAWPTWSTPGTFWGAAFALLIAVAVWLAYRAFLDGRLELAEVRAKAEQFNVHDHYVLFAAFLSLVNSGVEEYYWRWFVFGRCRRRCPLAWAAILSGLAFAAHHFIVLAVMFGAPIGAGLALAVAAGGAVWALLYDRYQSLYACWISHLLVDLAVMTIGYGMLFPAG